MKLMNNNVMRFPSSGTLSFVHGLMVKNKCLIEIGVATGDRTVDRYHNLSFRQKGCLSR